MDFMDLTYCAECHRDCDPTHPVAWSMAHRDYARQRAASLAPMSLPTTICRGRYTLAQQVAMAEVLERRGQPRRTLSVREAEATVSELRSPAATRRLLVAEEDDMIIRANRLRRA
jgi:hypothetical protein